MEAKGRLTNISINTATGRTCLGFEFEHLLPEAAEPLRNTDLRIKAEKWREKRSLNANAYFHVLVSKIAQAVGESNTETKNQLISDYGFPEMPPIQIIGRERDDWRKLAAVHLHPTSATRVLDNGELYRVYYLMRGSHTYDTKEMSRLIDGAVSEAKALGIETMTPEEIGRMLSAWKNEAR